VDEPEGTNEWGELSMTVPADVGGGGGPNWFIRI
jgi:hypothetical protein